MSLDILLLIATIVVAVLAVMASLLQSVLERRASGPPWASRGPRKVDARRLARAVPPPVRTGTSATTRADTLAALRADPSPSLAVATAAPVPVMEPSSPEPATAEETAAPVPVMEPSSQEAAAPVPVIEPSSPGEEAAAPVPVIEPSSPEPATAEEAAPAAAPVPVMEPSAETVPHAASVPEPELPGPGPVDTSTADLPVMAQVAIDTDDVPSPVAEPPTSPPIDRPAPVAAAALSVISASAPVTWRPEEHEPPEITTDKELAYRIGVPGAQRPSRPEALIVAGKERRMAALPATVATETWPSPRVAADARPSASPRSRPPSPGS